MVISQIAGLATAFGTGELSGAGFGPNYTILMKLGYEFFAPRILEEMEKNPNVFFQDTLWFQKFQKQIKLYSDTVMKETLQTLLTIPQETINAISNKFAEQQIPGIPGIPSPVGFPGNLSVSMQQAIINFLSKGITLNVAGAGTGDLFPKAFAEGPPGQTTSPTIPQGPPLESGQPNAFDNPIEEALDKFNKFKNKPKPPTPPSQEQQQTNLHPDFVASLSRLDLEKGGHRHRQTKFGLMHWRCQFKVRWLPTSKSYNVYQWITNGWKIGATKKPVSESSAYSRINVLKNQIGASYVVEFKKLTSVHFYLIQDSS